MGVETNTRIPKVAVLLVGGIYGSQPVGREVLVRLARHLGEAGLQPDFDPRGC